MRLVGLFLFLSCASVAAAQESGADPDERARLAFENGRRLYDAGEFEQAEREFETAYRITGRIELLYNIYLARRDGGRLPQAAEALREFVERRELGPDSPEARRLAALERSIAEGGTGEEEPQPESGGESAAPPPARSGGDGGGLVIGGAVLLGVGGVAVISSIVTGAMSLSDQATLANECVDRVCDPELEEVHARAGALAIATDVLWIGGAVLAAGGAALLVVGVTSSPSGSAELRFGPGSIAVRGVF